MFLSEKDEVLVLGIMNEYFSSISLNAISLDKWSAVNDLPTFEIHSNFPVSVYPIRR